MFLTPPTGTKTEAYIVEAIIWAASKSGLAPKVGVLEELPGSHERAKLIGLALGYIMGLRKNDCGNKDLAYADHYLQARVMVAYLGPSAKPLIQTIVVGYEVKKKIWEALGILEDMKSDNRCPKPVSPDTTSVKWGLAGAQDGEADFYVDGIQTAADVWDKIFS